MSKVIKLLVLLLIILAIFFFQKTNINPKWQEKLLVGLTKNEIIQFLGMPDEIDSLKSYMTYFDQQSNKALSLTLGHKLPINYEKMNEDEQFWFHHNYNEDNLVVIHIYIENTSLRTRYIIYNREERLLKLLKDKRTNYGYMD